MAGKAVIRFSTGREAKEAVRLALDGVAAGVTCTGCLPLPGLLARYDTAGGRFMACPVCFNARRLDQGGLPPSAELAGSVRLWEWIGDGERQPSATET